MKKLILLLAIPLLLSCTYDSDVNETLDCKLAGVGFVRERNQAIEDGDTQRANELLILINNQKKAQGCDPIK